MNKDVSGSFESHFGVLKDPRIKRLKLYPLTEILFVVLCGTRCGAESWRDFVLFGKEKLGFLRQHDSFEHGIPSKNTFARVLAVKRNWSLRSMAPNILLRLNMINNAQNI